MTASMPYQNLHLASEDGVALLTVNRPKARNALDRQTLEELEQALRAVGQDGTVRALILTGAGEKAFVAGADIAQMAAFTPEQAREFSGLGHRVCQLLEGLPVVTVAAVNGFALGGGCELALACDLLYASQTAKLGLPEVGLGVIPGFGGTQRLTRLVGKARAKELVFTGEVLDAAKAHALGLCLEVLAPEALLPHCKAVAQKIASKGPLAVAQAKRTIEFGADADLHSASELERQAFAVLFGSEDQREGMRAFLEKRPPAFKGR